MSNRTLIRTAIKELGITVPYNARLLPDGRVEIRTYGYDGTPVYWTPESASKPPPGAQKVTAQKADADFTEISGVGEATAKALQQAGFNTWRGLKRATDQQLLTVVNPRVLVNIRNHFDPDHRTQKE